ncbi:hypothetical protein NIES22_57850 [Calothrix brevissima NIES-22]|nr:hypothetical protein NIES22_57850 [Calothrix brevissima NIES-22]
MTTNIIFANNLVIDRTIQQEWLDILDVVRNDAYYYLSSFRNNAGYTEKLQTAFGNDFDGEVANQLFDSFAQGNFSAVPTIEIVNRNDINGANGAFSITTGKIYLAADFISQNSQNLDAIAAVLLEETGHFVDAQINKTDSFGDEGDIFARLVQGKSLSEQELAVLRAEDDTATVVLDGQAIKIEQNINTITFNASTFQFDTPSFSIDPTQKTIFLIHGWNSDPGSFGVNNGGLYGILDSQDTKANIIAVNWSSISKNLSYPTVVAQTDDVARALSDIFKTLNIDPNNTELIGHSLGAHVSGIAGKEYNRTTGKLLDRIIGLDAAGVGYGDPILTPPDMRLVQGDAKKVVGIYSSNAYHLYGAIVGLYYGPIYEGTEALGWYNQYADLNIYLYTNNFTSGGNGPGQLLGSGPGNYSNNHAFARDFYQMLARGDKYGSTTGWYWDEWRFTNPFNFDSLSSAQGQYTVSVEHPFRSGRSIIGTSGDNRLQVPTNNGDYTLIGLDGNDTLIGGVGADTLDGGLGEDTGDYSSATQGINVTLGGSGFATNDGFGNQDSLSGIDHIIGSQFNDTIVGDNFWANTLQGGAGNDSLNGLGGNDTLIGGAGDDTLIGGAGNDTLLGGDGEDTGDYSSATQGINVTLGGSGFATNDGFGNQDSLSGIDHIIGSQFNDTIVGDNFWANTLQGGAGNDSLNGLGGNDTLIGGAGNDTLWGHEGNDLLNGEQGNDWLTGEWGRDIVRGGDGDDVVLGGAEANDDSANDTLFGGAGNDFLDGEQGNDVLTGDAGADRFSFRNAYYGNDTITDFNRSQGDRIDIRFGATSLSQFNYNISNGALMFEVNGNFVNGDPIQFATLQNNPNFIVAQDIILG